MYPTSFVAGLHLKAYADHAPAVGDVTIDAVPVKVPSATSTPDSNPQIVRVAMTG
jgi:hypothetical protein